LSISRRSIRVGNGLFRNRNCREKVQYKGGVQDLEEFGFLGALLHLVPDGIGLSLFRHVPEVLGRCKGTLPALQGDDCLTAESDILLLQERVGAFGVEVLLGLVDLREQPPSLGPAQVVEILREVRVGTAGPPVAVDVVVGDVLGVPTGAWTLPLDLATESLFLETGGGEGDRPGAPFWRLEIDRLPRQGVVGHLEVGGSSLFEVQNWNDVCCLRKRKFTLNC